ncbi:MAG: OmpA family protein [Thiohalocapsa sp.]|jgi:outer membrane protein OmpA-like peptidoglycan-associated protein|uniref:OmpA family protein n=1 Tax=Thiohalocapsa sp. TaxID=2497641 RepID=UPI0025D9F28E|nr:OmpA family protein [Thiohalocapsa sp.]MCG6943522.1 OmpA family protein [Thiohalocapsa sp.]
MSQDNQPNTPPTAGKRAGAARTAVVLGVLATLFGGGVALLYTLTGGEIQLAGPVPPRPTAPAQAAPQPETRAPATEIASQQRPAPTVATQAADFASSAELAGLAAQLADAHARIDVLSEQSAGFAESIARIDALEAKVAAAKAAADAAASRAADVALRYTELTADYARLGAHFTPQGVLIRLDETALRFPPGTAELPAKADAALAEIAGFLARHPGHRALLRGHTDASGNAHANLSLSEQRAAAVHAALVALGVPGERMDIEGVGAAEPIADNASSTGRGQNRRVEILLRPADDTAG